jgi:hypothetical protein
MRSAIKALLLVNEYLEAEIEELQAADLTNSPSARFSRAKGGAA